MKVGGKNPPQQQVLVSAQSREVLAGKTGNADSVTPSEHTPGDVSEETDVIPFFPPGGDLSPASSVVGLMQKRDPEANATDASRLLARLHLATLFDMIKWFNGCFLVSSEV